MKLDVVMKQFKLKVQRLLLRKNFGSNENNCCFTDCIKTLKRWHAFECQWMDLIQICMMIEIVVLYILILVHLILTLIQGHRNVRKQKLMHQLSHKVFSELEWNLVDCYDLLM